MDLNVDRQIERRSAVISTAQEVMDYMEGQIELRKNGQNKYGWHSIAPTRTNPHPQSRFLAGNNSGKNSRNYVNKQGNAEKFANVVDIRKVNKRLVMDDKGQRLKAIFEALKALPEEQQERAFAEAIEALPKEQQDPTLTRLEKFAAAAQKAPAVTPPDISHVRIWGGVRKDHCSGIAYLEANYGNPEELRAKGLYSPTIRAHDPNLVDRVGKEARAQGKELSDFLPDRSDEVDDRAKAEGFDKQGRAVTGKARAVQATQRTMTSRRSRKRKKKAVSEAPTANHS